MTKKKKTVLLITGISLLFLLTPVGLSLLLQVPGVQNFIVHKTIDMVNKRIPGTIALSRIGIAMPGSLVLDSLLIRDDSNDTIIRASKVRVRIRLVELMRRNLNIPSARFSDCSVNIIRKSGDQKFNIQNLFSSGTPPDMVRHEKKAKSSSFSLNVRRVQCRKVQFLLDDRESGVQVESRVGLLAIKLDRFKLGKLQFGVNDLDLDSAFCAVRIFKKGPPKKKSKHTINLPQITATSVSVTNSSFLFEDTIAGNTIRTGAGGITIEKGDVDLNSQIISAHAAIIKGAAVDLGLTAHEAKSRPAETIVPTPKHATGNRWRISTGRLDLSESTFDFDMLNKSGAKSGFDAAHMHFRNIAVKATNAFYSARAIRAKLAHAAAQDPATTELKNLTVNFSMNEQGIFAQNLYIKTTSSDIRATCSTGFSPFNKNTNDILPNLPISVIFRPSTVSADEIKLFVPALAMEPVSKGKNRVIRLSGKIEGPVKSLRGDNISVTYGTTTDLRTDFVISRLPDVKNILLNFPSFTLTTIRDDVESLLGKNKVPRGLSIPSKVRLEAAFNGSMHSFRSKLLASLDNSTVSANMTLDSMKRYTGTIIVNDLNPGQIYLKAKKIGRTTLSATIDGQGFDWRMLSAHITIDAPSAHVDGYTYNNIKLGAHIDSQHYQGALSITDENLSIALQGDVQTAKDREALQCKLDLKRADLGKLLLLNDSLRVSGLIETDLKGRNLNTLSGMFNLTNLMLSKNGTDYRLDSLRCAIATTPQSQTLSIRSSILDARYSGAMPLDRAFKELSRQILGSLPWKQNTLDTAPDLHNMSLRLTVREHPLLNGLFLPKLTRLEGVTIQADYSEAGKKLTADALVHRGEYDGISFSGVRTTIHTQGNRLTGSFFAENIANAQATLTNMDVRGVSHKDQANFQVSTLGKNQDTALYAALSVKTSDSGIALALNPVRFYLGGFPWTVKKENSVVIKDGRFSIHDLTLSRKQSSLTIASVNTTDRDVISIAIRDFSLAFISQMLHKDSSFVDGTLNSDIDIIKQGEQSSLKASVGLRDIIVQKVKIGSLALAAENPEKGNYQFTAKLTGQGNDARIQGSISTGQGERTIDLSAAIKSLALQTIEPFTANAISESRGFLQGSFAYKGTLKRPIMSGKLVFNDASFKPAALNSTIRLGNEAIDIRNSGFYFNNFSINDRQNHMARVSGNAIMDSAGLFRFDLDANANDFLVLNTTERDNPVFYGRLIVDWQGAIHGTSHFPTIDARVALKAPSSITFAVPETRAKLDRGENIVVFSGPAASLPTENITDNKNTGTLKGIELASEIKIDKGVTLQLIPDPSTLDILVVRGDGALNLGLDKSGAINLTGTYSLSDGSYTVTLPPFLAKKFTIRSGSVLTWNGKPADANAAIVAQYSVSAAPIDLIYDQMTSASGEDKNSYRKPLKFLISLNLNGPFLKPDISFTLDLAPTDKGKFGGIIDAKLSQINQDPTALNKQVFALLVLGKFLPENPLDQSSGNNQLASVARSSVSGFLTTQLNQWGASLLPGVELNVGVQSYSSDTSNLATGKTMVDLGVKKQLFNDRLSVEVGGVFDVEGRSSGDKANQNMARDIGGNVAIEYKITRDGRYSLKGFRLTQYEGALDGQLTETGAGIVYSRNFNFWRQLFKRSKKGNDEP